MLRAVSSSRGAYGIPYVLAASGAAVSTTGDTTENTLAAVTIPGGSMGANGMVRVYTRWTITNSGNAKTLRVKFGAFTAMQRADVSIASSEKITIIMNRNSVSSQSSAANTATNFTTSISTNQTGSVNSAADVTLLITGQNTLGSETITLESYYVEIIRLD